LRVGFLIDGICPGANQFIYTLTNYLSSITGFFHGWQGLLENDFKLIRANEIEQFKKMGGSIVGSTRKISIFHDWKSKVIRVLTMNHIDLLVVLGSERSFPMVSELFSAGVKVVLLPCADSGSFCFSYRLGLTTVTLQLLNFFHSLNRYDHGSVTVLFPNGIEDVISKLRLASDFVLLRESDKASVIFRNHPARETTTIKILGMLSSAFPEKKDIEFARVCAKKLVDYLDNPKGGVLAEIDGGLKIIPLQYIKSQTEFTVERILEKVRE